MYVLGLFSLVYCLYQDYYYPLKRTKYYLKQRQKQVYTPRCTVDCGICEKDIPHDCL